MVGTRKCFSLHDGERLWGIETETKWNIFESLPSAVGWISRVIFPWILRVKDPPPQKKRSVTRKTLKYFYKHVYSSRRRETRNFVAYHDLAVCRRHAKFLPSADRHNGDYYAFFYGVVVVENRGVRDVLERNNLHVPRRYDCKSNIGSDQLKKMLFLDT